MLFDQQYMDTTYSDTHYALYNNNNKKNIGNATIHEYKSPHFMMKHSTEDDTIDRIDYLTQCQRCSDEFEQPITLPCGFTLCYKCLPDSTQCFSFSCLRSHQNVTNHKPTILIENILSNKDNPDTVKSLLDCSICLSTLVEPVTTQCGHTFCKECLIRTMTDMNSRSCPFCRTKLDRIGKLNQVVNGWIEYIYNTQQTDEQQKDTISLIQVTSAVAFPTQHCVFHLSNDYLLKNNNNQQQQQQKPYAICVFSKQNSNNEFYEYGIMLQIDHIEHSPDLRHSVVQATGLFRLKIHQLAIDLNDNFYSGDVTRLDDLSDNDFNIDNTTNKQSKRWTMPNTLVTTTHSTPSTPTTSISTANINTHTQTNNIPTSYKMTRPRPCSMRLSSSAPNNFNLPPPVENYYATGSRRAWGALLSKPSSPPLSFNALANTKKPKSLTTSRSSSTNTTTTLNNLFDLELHPHVINYLTCTNNNVWSMQYDWYLQNSDRNTIVWWISNVLPLEFNDKILLLSMETLRERIMTLIAWADKWQQPCF